jgi:hypothetical protein
MQLSIWWSLVAVVLAVMAEVALEDLELILDFLLHQELLTQLQLALGGHPAQMVLLALILFSLR